MRFLVVVIVLVLLGPGVQSQDIAVDKHSGQGGFYIPLFTVSDHVIGHSIGLGYDASGVKVDQVSGSTGQNWTLVGGGQVVRELRGLPDDFYGTSRKGWLYSSLTSSIATHSFPVDGATLTCLQETTLHTFLQSFQGQDSEPDVFHFSAGDIKGSFIFDNTGNINNIQLVPFQEIKVKAFRTTSTGPITQFQITTANGDLYTFSQAAPVTKHIGYLDPASVENYYNYFFTREEQFNNNVSYTGAWMLTSVTAVSGEQIGFTYVPKAKRTGHSKRAYVYNDLIGGYDLRNFYRTDETSTSLLLSEIATPRHTLNIFYRAYDFSVDSMLVDNIVLSEKNQLGSVINTRKVIFDYAYINGQEYSQRPFLRKLWMSNNCEILQPFVFEYYSINMASGTSDLVGPGSSFRDMWGYPFNDTGGSKLPKVYVYPGLSGIHRVSLYRKTGESNEVILGGANLINEETPTTGTLSQVTYPTGTVSFIEYEPHEFYNPITQGYSKGAGLRVKSIRVTDGVNFSQDLVTRYHYLKSDSSSSGKLLSLPRFWQLSNDYQQASYTDPYGSKVERSIYPYLSGISSMSTADQWYRLLMRFENNVDSYHEGNSQPVVYDRVTESLGTEKGSTVYEFENPITYATSGTVEEWNSSYSRVVRNGTCPTTFLKSGYHEDNLQRPMPFAYAQGLLKKISVYAHNQVLPVREEIFTYGIKSINPQTVISFRYENQYDGTVKSFSRNTIGANYLRVLTQKVTRMREKQPGTDYVELTTNYSYSPNHTLVAAVSNIDSDNTERISRTKYAIDYGVPGATTADEQVNMIDLLNSSGQYSTPVERISSVIEPGDAEKVMNAQLTVFQNSNTLMLPRIVPKEIWVAQDVDGIASFTSSAFAGSGSGRTFTKHAAYRKASWLQFSSTGNMLSAENRERQVTSAHHETFFRNTILEVTDAKPGEVVYSNFDNATDYTFGLTGFLAADKIAAGQTGQYGLGGWYNGSGKKITKRFFKKPGADYRFSTWYKAPVATGTHTLTLKVYDAAGVSLLLTESIPVTVTQANQWIYVEREVSVKSLAQAEVTVEVTFTGTLTSGNAASLDDVLFAPSQALVKRQTYHPLYGRTSVAGADGKFTKYEYSVFGRLEQVRDHNNDIREKFSYTRWSPDGSPNIVIMGSSMIFRYQSAQFKVMSNCLPYTSIEWKFSTSPSGGVFASGSETINNTFSGAGIYYVTVKLNHASYGSITATRMVEVRNTPITVSLTTSAPYTAGSPVEVNYCVENYVAPTLIEVVDGLLGDPYQIYFESRATGDLTAVWTPITTFPMSSSFEVRAIAVASDGRFAISNLLEFSMYCNTPPPGWPCSGTEPCDGN